MRRTRRSWLRDPQIRLPVLAGGGAIALSVGLGLLTGSWISAVMVGLTFFLAVLAVALVRLLIRRERDDVLHSGLREPPPHLHSPERAYGIPQRDRPGASERLPLDERFREVMRIVRSRHGSAGLYELPWWLVLGATGSGKTRLLESCGLDVPAEHASLASAPGSCGFVLSNDAVVIEAPGAWLGGDAEDWMLLLGQLRKARPRCALNGVLITLSAEWLLAGSGLVEHARDLRRRLNEVRVRLRVDAPVYVLVTQCDVLDGFAETRALLPSAWLEQAFGWSNDLRRIADPGDVAREVIEELAKRMERFLPEMLLRESDPQRQRALFAYPLELASLGKPLGEFLAVAFATDAYGDPSPFLRGFYLTSAGSDGRVQSSSLRRLGVARAPGIRAPAGPAFLHDVVFEVIAPDENVALPDRGIGPLGRRGIVGVAAAAAVWLLAVWGFSFAQNLEGTQALSRRVDRVRSTRAPTLDELAQLRERLEVDRARSASALQWLGFDRLSDGVEQARRTYVETFRASFDGAVRDNLAEALTSEGEAAIEAVIALTSDLRFLSSGGDGDPSIVPYRPTGIRDGEGFAREYASFVRLLSPEERARVLKQRERLKDTAETLVDLPLLEKITRRAGGQLPPVTYADFDLPVPRDAPMIEGIYTKKGLEGLVERVIGSSEARGVGLAREGIERFQRDYSERYLARWKAFLERAPVVPRSSSDVVGSPYPKLIVRADAELRVDLPAPPRDPEEERRGEADWQEILRQVRRSAILGDESEAEQEAEGPSLLDRARRTLGDLSPFSDPLGKEAGWSLYVAELKHVQETLDAVADAGDAEALAIANQIAAGEEESFAKAIDVVRREVLTERSTPFARKLLALLEAPILDGLGHVLDRAARELDVVWRAQVVDPYGSGQLSPIQLGELCGARDQLLDGELAVFLRAGQPKELLGERRLPLGPGFLAWVKRSGTVCGRSGPGAPNMVLRLQGRPPTLETPVASALIRSNTLQVTCGRGPDRYVYRSGSRDPHTFTWGADCDEVALRVEVRIDGQTRELQGPVRTGSSALGEFLSAGQKSPSEENVKEWKVEEDGIVVRVPYEILSGGGDFTRLTLPRPPASITR